MDNASDYGSEDSRFDSWLARSPSFDSPTIGCFVSGITVTMKYHASFQMHCMGTVTRTLLCDQFIVSLMPAQDWEDTEPPGRGK